MQIDLLQQVDDDLQNELIDKLRTYNHEYMGKEGGNKSSWHSGLHSNWCSRHLTEGMPGPVEVG
ncbi:hypothetical protein [Shewanella chilikensis]|uniref:hypothetical protein n=1 Tax=Shewanella chilikensis TaxID=558541 RepID=UPI00399C2397